MHVEQTKQNICTRLLMPKAVSTTTSTLALGGVQVEDTISAPPHVQNLVHASLSHWHLTVIFGTLRTFDLLRDETDFAFQQQET